ncbi:MAG: FMN-binding negative transcriptional regulator [Candidatus Eremiobacteraeota bacterium]|nr:FMN-binding negative transcriptional regulator [Candidatus Eremiobacteraeota bacterium]
MYVPAPNRRTDIEAAKQLIRTYPLGTVVNVVDGRPFVSYLPFVIASDEPLKLAGHLARANPQWTTLENREALIAFHGPHGYISPRWYADRSHNVPTWNYSTVHCTGIVRLASPAQTRPILRLLVEHLEAGASNAWDAGELADEYFDRLQQAIVACTFDVTGITAKFKLSQNKSDGDPALLIANLRATGREQDRLLARDMAHANNLE